MKSEADCYSLDDLKRDKQTSWGGVRNYQARNFMMCDMSVGDVVFFYYSGGTKELPAGIYGLATVSKLAHPDITQFDKSDDHYDPKAIKESLARPGSGRAIWYCVDIKFVKKFKNPMTLAEIKFDPNLTGIMVAQTGSRLSIQPVSQNHGEYLINNLR